MRGKMKATQTRFDIGFQEERNLPPFDETPIVMRAMLCLPLIIALQTGYEGHRMFETIKHWHPSSYSLMSHVVFGFCLIVPATSLLLMKKPLVVKKDFAMLVVICYWAATAAIQQAMKFILP